ncbi:hypothetical protein [Pseudonocardia thermophila]|uniref:hypothetical protein n=1 Tax=Pseudonocardia thermophila TaxID=1848 RepID=UPI00248DCFDF|nr:hypothetical protein [Pseudonocardia thermophila]
MSSCRSATPPVVASLAELLAGATDRVEVRTPDARSGARFERLRIGGDPHFLKIVSPAADWIMRVCGDDGSFEVRAWQGGLYAAMPGVVDHAVVGMALEDTADGPQLAILMTDRTADLVPPGDDVVPADHHADWIDHMAAGHAHFLGWRDTLGLLPLARRFRFFAPATIAPELAAPDVPGPVAVAHRGWGVLAERAPRLHGLVSAVHRDADALAEALRTTPGTFVAGDWKLGNVGRRPDGRTVLLDWLPGEAPPAWDLVWYVALNRARLPESKEATITRHRRRLEAHGVDTAGWWERQLGLCLVAAMATFGWEKAVGDAAELEWWEEAALAGARRW